MADMTVEAGDFKTEMTPIYNQETGQSGFVSSHHLDKINQGITVTNLLVRGRDGNKIGYFGDSWSTDVPTVEPTVETKVEPSKAVHENIKSLGTTYSGGPTQEDYKTKTKSKDVIGDINKLINKGKSSYDNLSAEEKTGAGILTIAAGAYGAGKFDAFLQNRAAREALMKRLGITDGRKLKGSFESLMDQMPEAFKGPNFRTGDVSIKPNPLDYDHMGGGPKFSGSGPFGVLPSEPFNPGSNPLEHVHEKTGKLITGHTGGFDIKPNNMEFEHMMGGPAHNLDPDDIKRPFKGSGAKIKGRVGAAIELLKQIMGK